MASNPLKDDVVLNNLLKDLSQIRDQNQFQRWRSTFLDRFNSFLEEGASNAASTRYQTFTSSVTILMRLCFKLKGFLDKGDMAPDKCTVNARLCLSELSSQIAVVMENQDHLIPSTKAMEDELGYTKFNIGAILVRDDFSDYRRLNLCGKILSKFQQSLAGVANSQVLDQMTMFKAKFSAFCDIMADLGLFQAMLKSSELAPDEEERQKKKQETSKSSDTTGKQEFDSKDKDTGDQRPAVASNKIKKENIQDPSPLHDSPKRANKKPSTKTISPKASPGTQSSAKSSLYRSAPDNPIGKMAGIEESPKASKMKPVLPSLEGVSKAPRRSSESGGEAVPANKSSSTPVKPRRRHSLTNSDNEAREVTPTRPRRTMSGLGNTNTPNNKRSIPCETSSKGSSEISPKGNSKRDGKRDIGKAKTPQSPESKADKHKPQKESNKSTPELVKSPQKKEHRKKQNLESSTGSGSSELKLCAIQPALRQSGESPIDAIKAILAAIDIVASKHNIDVFILPELAPVGYSMDTFKNFLPVTATMRTMYQKMDDAFASKAKKLNVFISYGTIGWMDTPDESLAFYIRQCVVDRKGILVSTCDKINLCDYGDYNESKFFKPGVGRQVIFTVNGFVCGTVFASDVVYPEVCRDLARDHGVDVILQPSACLRDSSFRSWRSFRESRAIENSVYFMGVNYGGESFGGSCFVPPWMDNINEPIELGTAVGFLTVTAQRGVLDQFRTNLPFYKKLMKERKNLKRDAGDSKA